MDLSLLNILEGFSINDIESCQEHQTCLFDDGNLKIYRIISNNFTSSTDFWYDQSEEEWLILMQGEAKLAFEDNSSVKLIKGSYLHIPAHKKHRIISTSSDPQCIWLTIHWKNKI